MLLWCIYIYTHTHTQVAVDGRVMMPDTHIHTPISTLHCLHRRIFLLHVYRSVSLARMRRYMQLAYLFHQYAKSLLSTDGRIADCTVRHPGVERPFSSFYRRLVSLHITLQYTGESLILVAFFKSID